MQRLFSVVVIFVLLLSVAPAGSAQSTLSADVLSLLSGGLSIEYESPLPSFGKEMSLIIPAGFRGGYSTYLSVGIGVRYYLDGRLHEGIYFGGSGMIGSVRDDVYAVSSALWVNATGGYKWMLDNDLVVDVGLVLPVPIVSDIYWDPPSHVLRAAVGYAF